MSFYGLPVLVKAISHISQCTDIAICSLNIQPPPLFIIDIECVSILYELHPTNINQIDICVRIYSKKKGVPYVLYYHVVVKGQHLIYRHVSALVTTLTQSPVCTHVSVGKTVKVVLKMQRFFFVLFFIHHLDQRVKNSLSCSQAFILFIVFTV